MVELQVHGHRDAADRDVGVVEGRVCDDGEGKEYGGCYEQEECTQICP